MAQYRAFPAGEHGGQPPSVLCEESVTDRVHAAVHGAQPAELYSVLDRPAPKT